ncbi:MAG: hypothetical protein HYU78_00735 [Rhodocyclales bacterium]|nr:hypothetical protein [Rhodocyclales bacterium]
MTRKQQKLIVAAMAVTMIGGAGAAEQHEHRHHHFPKDVDAFHGVLAPVWHAPRGKERNQDACTKAGRMERLAKDIRSTDASGLQASITTLTKQCQGGNGDVEGALFDVHEEFHRLIEPKKGA